MTYGRLIAILALFISSLSIYWMSPPSAKASNPNLMRFIQVSAKTREDRSRLNHAGLSIEAVRSDSVWGFASASVLNRLEKSGEKILGNFDLSVGRGGHEGIFDFPQYDSNFHNYNETLSELKMLQSQNADIVKVQSIGKSLEGRDLWALHINTEPQALQTGQSNKPGAIFMGAHHAREHVSVEIPLRLAAYLLSNRADSKISAMLASRDLWIIPMVNPDGAEYDIATGSYQYWRKNRRPNGDGTFGVDLNRNYSFHWGTGGSDTDTSSDVYMGTAPFSEPETQVIRDFVGAHLNAKVLLTFHTFSELVLYPWGHTYDKIGDKIGTKQDYNVFKTMAETMAQWNGYTPEQSSDLYIASGDTTDWAYGEHGMFAFTFEMSPNQSAGAGGFYPGEGILDKVFNDNLKPCLYLIDSADNPYKTLNHQPSMWLKNLIEPSIPNGF